MSFLMECIHLARRSEYLGVELVVKPVTMGITRQLMLDYGGRQQLWCGFLGLKLEYCIWHECSIRRQRK